MIKINLLPPWIHEPKRIIILTVICLVIGGTGAGVLNAAKNDLLGPVDAYYKDIAAYGKQQKLCEEQATIANTWQTDSTQYDAYVKFFSGAGVKAYNNSIADVLEEVATKIGTYPGAYYQSVTISDKSVTLSGKIKGLMNFANYYFKMKAAGMKLTPNAKPYATSLDQEIALATSGSITKSVATAPTPPTGTPASVYTDLYKAAGGGGAGGAGGAGAPGGGGPPPTTAPTTGVIAPK